MDHSFFIIRAPILKLSQNFTVPLELADKIRTVPGFVDAFTDPYRIGRVDTNGPTMASAESVSMFMNGINRCPRMDFEMNMHLILYFATFSNEFQT